MVLVVMLCVGFFGFCFFLLVVVVAFFVSKTSLSQTLLPRQGSHLHKDITVNVVTVVKVFII